MTLEDECLLYAASSGNEVCGLILDNSYLVRCQNIHADPSRHFRISDEDWINADAAGEITAVFHSHPSLKLTLSGADRQTQHSTGVTFWLASGGKLRKFRAVPPLLGRRFIHGSQDCYALFRDAYHLCGIDLPDFDRTNGWWVRGENLYIRNMAVNGFHEVSASEIRPGDVIIRRAFPESDPCHAMIWLGDGSVLHHEIHGRLSRREPYRREWAELTHSIWRYTKCSDFDFTGVSDDISAKSP